MDHSKLKPYSLALVANNKPMTTGLIQATPIESLTMLDGELGSLPQDQETDGKDATGQAYQTKVTTDTAVDAEWLPFGSNRQTAPDVRRGERVLLWQYADTDTFYWQSLGLDDHLRKLETAIFSISATAEEGKDGTMPENSYSVEMSSHTGQITIRTSKANKEFCAYGVQIDAKNGKVAIVDDLGNEIVMDSKNTKIWMTNVDKSTVQLDKKKILIQCADTLDMIASQVINIQTKNLNLKATNIVSQATLTRFKGRVEFDDNVAFKSPITAKGITSTVKIQGPTDSI